jgi:alpha-glucosidase
MGLLLMFLIPGSPGLYYGDEIGMAGFTDPDNRRPYPWNNLNEFNKNNLEFTKSLIDFYKTSDTFKYSSFKFIQWFDGYISFILWDQNDSFLVFINSNNKKEISIPNNLIGEIKDPKVVFKTRNEVINISNENEKLSLNLPEKIGVVVKL